MPQLIFREISCFSSPWRELESVFLAFKTILTGLMSSFERSIKLRKRFPTRFRMKESVREKVAFRRELCHFSAFGRRSTEGYQSSIIWEQTACGVVQALVLWTSYDAKSWPEQLEEFQRYLHLPGGTLYNILEAPTHAKWSDGFREALFKSLKHPNETATTMCIRIVRTAVSKLRYY